MQMVMQPVGAGPVGCHLQAGMAAGFLDGDRGQTQAQLDAPIAGRHRIHGSGYGA